MTQDPSAKTHEHNPYGVLAQAGVTPASTMQAVQDAAFELMAQADADDGWLDAWDELRFVPRRLVQDFFLYGTPGE